MNRRYPLAGERVPPVSHHSHRSAAQQLPWLIVGIVLGMGLLGLFMRAVGV